jgi:methylated-DNA-protein-cysteine methyltransferase-like protein
MRERDEMNEPEMLPDERVAFNGAVWKITRQIPAGKVASYGQIAGYIPRPGSVAPGEYEAFRARWAGYAMAACPPDVPWQRVINAQGKISIRKGAERQRELLETEGVVFDERGRVDMKRYGWEGPSPDWLRDNQLVAPDDPQQLNLFS